MSLFELYALIGGPALVFLFAGFLIYLDAPPHGPAK